MKFTGERTGDQMPYYPAATNRWVEVLAHEAAFTMLQRELGAEKATQVTKAWKQSGRQVAVKFSINSDDLI